MSKIPPYMYGNIKLERGSFELPPILIGTIFYQGQSFIERTDEKIFNKDKAKKRIESQKTLGEKYKIPEMVEISGNTPESMIEYLKFYLDNFEPPFILGGTLDARIAGIQYLEERGVKPDEYIYNAISNLKNKNEIEMIKKSKILSVVILMLASQNMSSTQRYGYITNKTGPNNTNLIDGLKQLGVEKIWIDGGVINLESLAHILETQRMISASLHLPVGTAPNLFLFKYSSPRANHKFHTKYRRANIMFAATWFSNFIFYGAIEDAKECFSAAFQTQEFKNILKQKNIKIFDK
ncbi:MAG: hypothetical protein ACFFBP_16115 [Promethearchaeota archaeon]